MRLRSVNRRARRGVMLLIVTLILTALTLSGAALLTLMKTENEATNTRGREELTRGVARSAVVYLVGCLEHSQTEREQLGGLYNNPNAFCAKELLTLDEGGDDVSRFTIISPKLEDTNLEGIRYGLVDESTRLNLQGVLEWDREEPGTGRAALMKLPGMTAAAADSILDWIDPDEQPRQNGAEAKYYANQKLPYSPRNATPVFLEELLLARGVTRTQLYGSDENFTYNAEKTSADSEANALGGSLLGAPTVNAPTSAARSEAAPWTALLTVFSAEKDVDPKGEARVNLNVDNLEFLYQELESRVGADVAKFVVLYRQYGPETTDDASNAAPAGPGQRANRRASGYNQQGGQGAAGRGGRQSGYFQQGGGAPGANANANSNVPTAPLAQAQINYGTPATTTLKTPLDIVGARVVVNGTAYASPIADSTAGANINKIMTLLDYASTSDSTTIIGRVNVNAAPRAVLSALPGITTADVQRIMDARPKPDATLPAEFRHAAWLYAKGIVNLQTMKRLYNKTTGRGDVYRGQIVGFLDNSNETSRAEVVVDATTIPPRQVFYKDLSTLGKGFSDASLLGGLTSGDSEAGVDVSPLDWAAASGVLDIERENGYTSAASDAFSALDSLANAAGGGLNSADASGGSASASLGGAGLGMDTGTGAPGTGSTDAFATGGLTGDATVTDPLAAGTGGGTSTAAGGTESRRDRMLNALQTAREGRQSRNLGLAGGGNGGGAAATDSADAEDASDADAGGFAGGFTGGAGTGANGGGNGNAGGGNNNAGGGRGGNGGGNNNGGGGGRGGRGGRN